MEAFWFLLPWILGWSASAIVGLGFGQGFRNQAWAGFFIGLLFGPLGWVVVFALPDRRPKCPQCRGVIVEGAYRCKNCGAPLRGGTSIGSVRYEPKEDDEHDDDVMDWLKK